MRLLTTLKISNICQCIWSGIPATLFFTDANEFFIFKSWHWHHHWLIHWQTHKVQCDKLKTGLVNGHNSLSLVMCTILYWPYTDCLSSSPPSNLATTAHFVKPSFSLDMYQQKQHQAGRGWHLLPGQTNQCEKSSDLDYKKVKLSQSVLLCILQIW